MKRIYVFMATFLATGLMLSNSSVAQTKVREESLLSRYEKMRVRSRLPHPVLQSKYPWMTESYLRIDPMHPQSFGASFDDDNPFEWFLDPDYSQLLNRKGMAENPFYLNHPAGVREEWVHIYESGTVPSWDVATDLAIDQESHVYVTGYTTNLPHGLDFYTIKYDAIGNQIWAVYFDGEASGDDMAWKIALDDTGNVYVGGTSSGLGSGTDFAVVKYNNQGQQQWVARYDGIIHGDDELQDMVVDNLGNVYATGVNVADYVTVKYNSQGLQEWEARYDGPANMYDQPTAIAVDMNGNVYVTGRSSGIDTGINYATVKYNEEGVQQWTALFTGKKEDFGSYDQPNAITVDDSGNVFVTGHTEIDYDDWNYTTIKYSKNGEQLWVAFYDGERIDNSLDEACDIALDKEGNVYVTGWSRVNPGQYNDDFATVKYNSDGVEQWVAKYGEDEFHEGANAITIDNSGNIYVIGTGYVTIKYNPDGRQIWLAQYSGSDFYGVAPNAMAVNNQGDVFITGEIRGLETYFDYATVKYNNQGIVEWAAQFNGKNREYGYANDLCLDDRGNIYVTGGNNGEFITIKYDPAGNPEWTARYSGDENEWSEAITLAVDKNENVYVVGREGGAGVYEATVIKYNSHGNQEWISHFEAYFPHAIVLDNSGNAYVIGNDFITIKYNSDGVQEWVNSYNNGENNYFEASDIAVDNKGNVYVTGSDYGEESGFITVKYNSQGQQKWAVRYFGSPGAITYAGVIALDGWGNIYVVGRTWSSSNHEFAIVKYNPDGIQQWAVRYKEQDQSCRRVNDIAVDVVGNVYVAGYIENVNTYDWDFITMKYNTNGTEQWAVHYDGFGNWDRPNSLVLDCESNVYVTGESWGIDTGVDMATIKYNSDGEEQWVIRYQGTANADDWPEGMAIDAAGNIYIAGSTRGHGWSYFKTIKYSQTGEDSLTAPLITSYKIEQNFPNPFNKQTLIYYKLPRSSSVIFKIFNSLGQQVIYDDLGQQPEGMHAYYLRVDRLPSGIYYYQLQADDFINTRRMIVIH